LLKALAINGLHALLFSFRGDTAHGARQVGVVFHCKAQAYPIQQETQEHEG